ncbi:sulfur carrier protein ThiS [soil metagenome]
MEIKINNDQIQVAEGSSVAHLVNFTFGEKQKGIAVAVNDAVIPKNNWNEYLLKDNDKVLIIKATQGG